MTDPEAISFYSDGLKIAADFYLPPRSTRGEKLPAVVLCHGFGGLRGFLFPHFARYFKRFGYAALTLDHCNTGDREGTPRHLLDPIGQVADLRHAVSYLETRGEIDAGRIALYGISFGAANAVYATAIDPRIATIISVVGYGDGERWLRALRREWEWIEFRERVAADQRRRALGENSELVDTTEVYMHDPEALEHEREARANDPCRVTEVPLATAEAIISFKLEQVVDRISPRPCFFIGVADDTLVPTEETLSLFARASEPKRLHLFPAIGHHAVYYGDWLDKLLDMAVAWFDEHLKP